MLDRSDHGSACMAFRLFESYDGRLEPTAIALRCRIETMTSGSGGEFSCTHTGKRSNCHCKLFRVNFIPDVFSRHG